MEILLLLCFGRLGGSTATAMCSVTARQRAMRRQPQRARCFTVLKRGILEMGTVQKAGTESWVTIVLTKILNVIITHRSLVTTIYSVTRVLCVLTYFRTI